MSTTPSPWAYKGIPSQIGKSLIKTQTAPKSPAPPITFIKKHPLRSAEAQAIGSKSRAPTASINTEPARIRRVKGAAI